MSMQPIEPSNSYTNLLKEAELNVKEVGLGEYTLEEKDLIRVIEIMKHIKLKYSPVQVATYVKLLKNSSTLQGLSAEFKKETMRELRKMKFVQEIVEFDWVF